MYRVTEDLQKYLDEHLEETHRLLKDLATIPSPSHFEDERAAFCKSWLEAAGATGVYIDKAKNVIFPMNCEGHDDIALFMAHTDIVFSAETPLDFRSDGERFYCPGVGDDTCSVAIMFMIIKYIISRGIKPSRGILFVANSCEEGLGNLKGSRQVMEDFSGRIKEFYTFDGHYTSLVTKCVGSHRYEIECTTEGGHSYGKSGNPNAIAELSQLICDLYTVEVPARENTKTTYNVGTIAGGTSVNTIAQSAKMLYEYRSDDAECLAIMKNAFEEKLEAARKRAEGLAEFSVNVVGIRPCGGEIDENLHRQMIERVTEICERHSGLPCVLRSGSTDCNTPMSMGVPAVCAGTWTGAGAHTLGEYVNIDSIPIGLRICAEIILDLF